jgi:hypothetical protein
MDGGGEFGRVGVWGKCLIDDEYEDERAGGNGDDGGRE